MALPRQVPAVRLLQAVGVSMDDAEPPVRDVYLKYGLNYPVVMGDEKLGELYGGVLGLPVTLSHRQEREDPLRASGGDRSQRDRA